MFRGGWGTLPGLDGRCLVGNRVSDHGFGEDVDWVGDQ